MISQVSIIAFDGDVKGMIVIVYQTLIRPDGTWGFTILLGKSEKEVIRCLLLLDI